MAVAAARRSFEDRAHRRAFGLWVQTLRQQRGWTQQTLAVRADIHRSYRAAETRLRNPTLDVITKIATGLAVPVADLFVIAKTATDLTGTRFAVIVDEAHSSQSGESAEGLKRSSVFTTPARPVRSPLRPLRATRTSKGRARSRHHGAAALRPLREDLLCHHSAGSPLRLGGSSHLRPGPSIPG